MTRRYAPLLATLLIIGASQPALAQAKDPAAADALFRQGREAMKSKDYAVACPKFAESQRLDPAPGTLLNLAQCEEALGNTASAVQHYRDVAELLPASDPRVNHARGRVTALTPQVPLLTIKLAPGSPDGARVTRNGVELGAASMGVALPVDPGKHEIVVSAPGRKNARTVVSIQSGKSREITVGAGDEDAAGIASGTNENGGTAAQPKDTGVTDMSAGPTEADGSTIRTLGWIATGLGVVGLGVGGYFVTRANSLNEDAKSEGHFIARSYCDSYCADKTAESREASKIAYGGLIGGGTLLVGGLAMILFAPSGSSSKATRPTVSLTGGPGLMGLGMGGAW